MHAHHTKKRARKHICIITEVLGEPRMEAAGAVGICQEDDRTAHIEDLAPRTPEFKGKNFPFQKEVLGK